MKKEVAVELSFEGLIDLDVARWEGKGALGKGNGTTKGRKLAVYRGQFTLLEIKIDNLKCVLIKSNSNKLIAC